ncbi:hypothetical protein GCM10009416_47420 [Craurococcus roseus]|uniref:Uncharacterized protein n=1 Tax=Craurococcus roseus TaxID=77585 RepID=A0ABN1G5D0_9PROT
MMVRRFGLSGSAVDSRFLVAFLVLVLVLVLEGVASCIALGWSGDADGFTRLGLRDRVDEVRKRLLQLPDISKIDVLGARDGRVHVGFPTERPAALGIGRAALAAAPRARGAAP